MENYIKMNHTINTKMIQT